MLHTYQHKHVSQFVKAIDVNIHEVLQLSTPLSLTLLLGPTQHVEEKQIIGHRESKIGYRQSPCWGCFRKIIQIPLRAVVEAVI